MTTASLPLPRTRRPKRGTGEMAYWLFMRVSGVALLVLIFTHLIVNLVVGDGISAINFGFVAGKLADPLWQIWDLLMLWLAMIHGTNGMRVVINDYVHRPGLRLAAKIALGAAFTLVVVVGTLVIFTFDPCPMGADPSLLPSFCTS